MCLALLDGRAWTAVELAACAGIARSTASEHLTALVSSGLLVERRQGRHRYVCLASPQVAELLETLTAAVGRPPQPSSLRSSRARDQLAAGRTCYDHLAGALGVGLLDGLVARGVVVGDGSALTTAGRSWFGELAGEQALRPPNRPLLRTCLDWTERCPHLGGALGAALCSQLFERGWTARLEHHPRAVAVTAAGRLALGPLLPDDLPPADAAGGSALQEPAARGRRHGQDSGRSPAP